MVRLVAWGPGRFCSLQMLSTLYIWEWETFKDPWMGQRVGESRKPKICAEGEQRTLPACLGVQSLSVSKPLCRKVGATEIRDRVRSGLSPQFCPASNLHRVWRSSRDQTVCCCELALSVSAVNLRWLGFLFTAEGRATDHPAFHNPRTNSSPA